MDNIVNKRTSIIFKESIKRIFDIYSNINTFHEMLNSLESAPFPSTASLSHHLLSQLQIEEIKENEYYKSIKYFPIIYKDVEIETKFDIFWNTMDLNTILVIDMSYNIDYDFEESYRTITDIIEKSTLAYLAEQTVIATNEESIIINSTYEKILEILGDSSHFQQLLPSTTNIIIFNGNFLDECKITINNNNSVIIMNVESIKVVPNDCVEILIKNVQQDDIIQTVVCRIMIIDENKCIIIIKHMLRENTGVDVIKMLSTTKKQILSEMKNSLDNCEV
jgi:hypothetical protein